jgi:hypothetical protein
VFDAAVPFVTSRRPFGFRDSLALLVMSVAVMAVYWSFSTDSDSMLVGLDYWQLHSRRMQFARDALLGSAHALPGWYPRELLGTPFWSNVQNFPFIPTRLLVVLTMDPLGPYTYLIAVTLSAILAALFTYFYLRKIGLSLIGSAAAGWTFACNGFYAARIAAGHLPLLEAYPALPLLAWLIESALQAEERGESLRRWIAALAISSGCLILAGHPQLPAYALGIGGLYALLRGGVCRAIGVWGFTALGAGIASFALIPMVMLIGRSTRVLPLTIPDNDVSMPYPRLLAFFYAWQDGAPRPLGRASMHPFEGYPNWAYFWETSSYSGLLPWIALLLVLWLVARGKLDKPQQTAGVFMLILALAGIVLSLPFVHSAMSLIPGTIFRSPARLIYLTEFSLAAALGIAVHAAFMIVRSRIAQVVLLCLLIVHGWDLGGHSREFIMRAPLLPRADSEALAELSFKNIGDGRVAMDYFLATPLNRSVDDVGFFDSIMLARPYQAIVSLADLPADLNVQSFNGSEVPSRALAALGVKAVITASAREDLAKAGQVGEISTYNVALPSRRAEFFDIDQIRYLSTEQIHAALRHPKIDLRSVLLLPRDGPSLAAESPSSSDSPAVEYQRPDSDHIEVTVTTGRSGYLRVIESWDPGWSATIDDVPVQIVPAMDMLLAVPVSPGSHKIRFAYSTPGAGIGRAVSIISLTLLCYLIWTSRRKRQSQQFHAA